jgi:hypothetical protein
MKKLVVASWLLLALAMPMFSASRQNLWKQVDDAINQGLPKTAIEALDPIIQGALKDKAYGEAVKAIARKIVLEANIQGNKPEEKITRMEAEIARAPQEMSPLLETILANWYWHYFQQNRWRFLQRTATAEAPGKDFTTWDLPRLFREIDRHFAAALASADLLKKTPVTAFDQLLEKGTLPDSYRPTLYDFIAHEALEFYASGEQAAAKPEDAFEISADGPIFDDVPGFLAWKPQTAQTDAPALKAIQLFQALLQFHQNDREPTALVDADLARLVYNYNTAFGETKATRYRAALKSLTDRWGDNEVSAMGLYHWARLLQEEGDLVEARRLALRAANAFQGSQGGKMCRNLIMDIEAKSASITTERVWNAPLTKIAVHYRNISNVYFRAVPYDWEIFLQKNHSRPESLNEQERRDLLAAKPVLEWSAKLPPTTDYKERTQELPAPTQLKAGFYFLIASHQPDFGEPDNQVSYVDIWVSDLALVVRSANRRLEGFVLQANSGEPISGAEVMGFYLNSNGDRIAQPAVRSDENGFFSFTTTQQRGYLLRARYQGQELASVQDYWQYTAGKATPFLQTVFFTDRALYRPGQTIQYKGLALRVDQEKSNYEVLSGRRITVVFEDPNQKEIARAEHQCNDYGSFSGSFTAPRDRVMGRMRIRVTSGERGETSFNVEEYKRPKFHVTLEAPKTAAKLNAAVNLQGKALSYTAAAIDGAMVKYRVVREVRWPYWWGWYHRWPPSAEGSQEIAHGQTQTDTDGSFKIEFFAKPDPKVSEKDEAFFNFMVYADVTDTTGETRSDQRAINVGFTALQATLSANDWQTADQPVELVIKTTTLDGEPQVAEGSLKIYRLKQPAQVQRPPLLNDGRFGAGATENQTPDRSDPNHWELDTVAVEKGFTTDAEGKLTVPLKLDSGAYRAILETQDRFGKKVTALLPLQVLNPGDTHLTIKVPHVLAAPSWDAEPGHEFRALWGSGYDTGRAFIELERRQQIIERYWTKPGQTQQEIKLAVTEAMRGGFTLHVTQVRENRAYLDSRRIDVPWTNKDLDVKWEHFVSKLQPGQKETWTAVITGPKAEKAAAEMVATLYDASLDAYLPHHWLQRFGFYYQDYSNRNSSFWNIATDFRLLKGGWHQDYVGVETSYRHFPNDLIANFWGFGAPGGVRRFALAGNMALAKSAPRMMLMRAAPAPATASMAAATPVLGDMPALGVDFAEAKASAKGGIGGAAGGPPAEKGPDLNQIVARKNLNETAFFFPQLISDKDGVVRLTFTMPEALTEWRFMAFAHDRQCRSGYLQDKAVTSKDLMVQPNPPRFLREGDTLEFTVKVSNQTAARQEGKVRLTFNDALTDQSADAALGNAQPEIPFDIPSKQSRSFSWRITVPDGCGFLTYKAVGSTGRVSDGEEGNLPVLSRRILVTESLCLPIRGPATNHYSFTHLLQSGQSSTLKNQSLTVQMVSHPAWYAIMALPYLMEFPYECSEQTFNRLYANSLARTIANSDPKIRRVFDQWKGTPALESPLEKNQDLKSVAIEETPWLRQAENEGQARKNVGILFDENRLNSETAQILQKLTEMQLGDGSWPWFPGGHGNDYITLYITTGFGRLRHLGADLPVTAALKSLNRLDTWMDDHYRLILQRPDKQDYVPSSLDAFYLYGRSFFLKDKPIAPTHQQAVEFFLGQARKLWLKLADRQSQGHLAIALNRWGGDANRGSAQAIMRSLKERSVTNEELGMFWRETELSCWWYRAPIETQALMIEAFDEVMNDTQSVEECRVWLLKQKQTQNWKTTKATADAVYGLLLRGRDLLASDKLVEVTLDNTLIRPETPRDPTTPAVEAGTGFYEKRISAGDIKAAMGEITVRKIDQGVAWGAVHWQYLEDMAKVHSYEGTPLKLKKSLYTKVATGKGQVLEPMTGALKVGDELVVRIELRVDRDMEYVHLKDQRGSGTEPVSVLSRYKYQDGLAYYESTRDTASHFFIDYLPKGTYVFEYSSRIQHRGQYQTGMAEIQCLYAPEFNGHSQSFVLKVE